MCLNCTEMFPNIPSIQPIFFNTLLSWRLGGSCTAELNKHWIVERDHSMFISGLFFFLVTIVALDILWTARGKWEENNKDSQQKPLFFDLGVLSRWLNWHLNTVRMCEDELSAAKRSVPLECSSAASQSHFWLSVTVRSHLKRGAGWGYSL